MNTRGLRRGRQCRLPCPGRLLRLRGQVMADGVDRKECSGCPTSQTGMTTASRRTRNDRIDMPRALLLYSIGYSDRAGARVDRDDSARGLEWGGEKLRSGAVDRVAEQSAQADYASELFKILAHRTRLLLLCQLAEHERSVAELEAILNLPQAAVSQQLARLRLQGLVATRRAGRSVIYRLVNENIRDLLKTATSMEAGHTAGSWGSRILRG